MAGIYGQTAEHYAESKGIYQIGWRQKNRSKLEKTALFSDWINMRSHVNSFDGFLPNHSVQI